MRDQINSLIRDSGVARVAEELAGLLRPAVAVAEAEQESAAADRSAFGPAAGLPTGLDWPTWRGEPLPLLADLRPAELRPFDGAGELPRDGRLLFFFQASALEDYPPEPGSWRVIHCPDGPRGSDGATPVAGSPAPRNLRFAHRLTLPPLESAAVEALALDEDESDAYTDLLESVDELYAAEGPHQLLGNPWQLQGDLQQECLADTGRGSAPDDWRLLLQLAESKDMVWGDGGMLYFFIREQALREADFSDVHLVMQSG